MGVDKGRNYCKKLACEKEENSNEKGMGEGSASTVASKQG
jgi:hypothetical protein